MTDRIQKIWQAFLQWKVWGAAGRACSALVRWSGWRAPLRWRVWGRIGSWRGWRKLFCLGPLPGLLLTALSGAGLYWVFSGGRDQSAAAIGVYVLSAYTLCVLCASIPGYVRSALAWLDAHPRLRQLLDDQELRFALGLYAEQAVNLGYGLFKIAGGLIIGSAWIGADGIYNLVQGLIQLFQILRRRKELSPLRQWRSYRVCGWLVLLMHMTLLGPVFQMVNWGRAEDHPGYMIFATAAFTFYKLIDSMVDVARDRSHRSPIDSSVRLLDLAQSLFALFSLQVSLLHTFGEGASFEHLLNMISGCVVCALVMGMGIYMICRACREINHIKENDHG